ncbi:MAG: hypothetical protein GY943_03610 [Chloroflexi bacterium]|nr:hypothetical protein [Chloroflexota bacterium]
MLQNPAYAGAFAYGRRQVDPTLRKPGRQASGRRRKPVSAWLHLQQDVYPAYINLSYRPCRAYNKKGSHSQAAFQKIQYQFNLKYPGCAPRWNAS